MKIKIFNIGMTMLLSCLISCKNEAIELPDFDYQTVYFANQYPVRTIVLGNDAVVDNTLDNEHKVEIKATLGGTRDNKKNVVIDVEVANSLLDGLYFPNNGSKLEPLPANYYSLTSNQIIISPGNIMGGVQVALTDAFFADPHALSNRYVIPLRMKNVANADSILRSKDFVFYALKFINPWHGNYLRRGSDQMTGDVSRQVVRRASYVEQDEINTLETRSLHSVVFPVQFRDADAGNIFSCRLLLNFDDSGRCTVSTDTPGYTATGGGVFIAHGEKNSWGNRDRDALYLDYQIAYSNIAVGSGTNARSITGNISSKDTLVSRDRGVSPEYFVPQTR
ncbi:DUF5627 domain-containing protein [Sphingobacterium griseoflavum]|uniref:DUF1735 domain-containing protein n=1 Tax=Sphingobacterium griseoflavum TaxID=1474952 RepID=A0ABQ3HUC9_9SPHI|nr:DUF5627 domain-containing protein [Sphingobacterium griseoflavum]GHE35254.1 hypothetical protein GCM10017764_18140 [Sphingobacterium griseoflavum]